MKKNTLKTVGEQKWWVIIGNKECTHAAMVSCIAALVLLSWCVSCAAHDASINAATDADTARRAASLLWGASIGFDSHSGNLGSFF